MISVELLHQLFSYDNHTGNLIWKPRPVTMFTDGAQSAQHACKRWNTRFANNVAGSIFPDGYKSVSIFGGKKYKNHRIVWLMHYFYLPDEIDHINHDRLNNRLHNLRPANSQINRQNQSMHHGNTSGFNGVSWNKNAGKWRAYVTHRGTQLHLGLYTDKQAAINARQAANIKYGFFHNHGI